MGDCVAFGVLVNVRPLSLVMAAVVLGALLLILVPPISVLGRLVRTNVAPTIFAAVAVLAAVVWLLGVYVPAFGANAEMMDAFRGFDTVERVLRATARIDEVFPEYVIVTGWLDTYPPTAVHVVWYGFVAVAVVAAWQAARRFRITVAVLGGASLLVPIGLMASSGLRWQGRYTLPLIAPALAVCLWALAAPEFAHRRHRLADAVLPVGLVLMVVTTAISMYWTVIRFAYGFVVDPLYPTLPRPRGTAEWRPPLGLAAGSLVAVVGLALPLVVYRVLGRPGHREPAPVDDATWTDGLAEPTGSGSRAGEPGTLGR